jgi:hypothetical protein
VLSEVQSMSTRYQVVARAPKRTRKGPEDLIITLGALFVSRD